MAVIHILDKHTAELIAAGEVVERPASVVKELCENAIDAGATNVTVSIEHGGVSCIEIADNGSGIEAEYIPAAFVRHATSKIEHAADLESIHTLGFRGEALASVASVARVTLLTRTPEDEFACCYRIYGGEEQGVEAAARPVGTTITVRDLFYNTPARMKFLKKDVSEGTYVADVVTEVALSHPEIAFKFVREGKTQFQTSGDGRLQSAVYAALSRDFARDLVNVDFTEGLYRVTGSVTAPKGARASRAMQYFYINGRFVKNRTMMAALEAAYKGMMMQGRFPGCVLTLTMPPQLVDVNVHPAKTEVRFAREKDVFDAVYHAVRSALQAPEALSQEFVFAGGAAPDASAQEEHPAAAAEGAADAAAPAEPETAGAARQEAAQAGLKPAAAGADGRRPLPNPVGAPPVKPLPNPAGAPPVQPLPNPGGMPPLRPLVHRGVEAVPAASFAGVVPLPGRVPDADPARRVLASDASVPYRTQGWQPGAARADVLYDEPDADAPAAAGDVLPRTGDHAENPAAANAVCPPPAGAQETLPGGADALSGGAAAAAAGTPAAQLSLEKEGPAPLAYLGEAFRTYIIAQRGDELCFIDKHAAHERILYEKLAAQYGRVPGQMLLAPVTVRLSAEEKDAVLQNGALLRDSGIEAEDFGGNTVIVRAAPADVVPGDVEDLVVELASGLVHNPREAQSEKTQWVLHSIACRAAVKAGEKNSAAELLALARQVLDGEIPPFCPHGRPVLLRMTKKELEKQFGRQG